MMGTMSTSLSEWLFNSTLKAPAFYFFAIIATCLSLISPPKGIGLFILSLPTVLGILFTGALASLAISCGLLDWGIINELQRRDLETKGRQSYYFLYLSNLKYDFGGICFSFFACVFITLIYLSDLPVRFPFAEANNAPLSLRILYFTALMMLCLSLRSLLKIGKTFLAFLDLKFS
jgi:hypothetical protein